MIVKGHTVRSDIDTLHKSSKYLSHPLEQTSKVRVKIIVTLTFRNIYIYMLIQLLYIKIVQQLVGDFNPFEKHYCSQNWILPPGRGENKTYLKPSNTKNH